MAEIYQPLQRQSGGRWDYTVSSDENRSTYLTGYCCGDFDTVWPIEPTTGLLDPEQWASARAEALPFASKYHGDGHATAEEASACFLEYQLDRVLTFTNDDDEQRKCQVCGAWTTGRATVGLSRRYSLCDQHRSRQHVADLASRERLNDGT
jgi:hypothetical protein